MKVVEMNQPQIKRIEEARTYEDLVKEYDAYICVNIIEKLYQEELITREEKEQIRHKIIRKYTPYLL